MSCEKEGSAHYACECITKRLYALRLALEEIRRAPTDASIRDVQWIAEKTLKGLEEKEKR